MAHIDGGQLGDEHTKRVLDNRKKRSSAVAGFMVMFAIIIGLVSMSTTAGAAEEDERAAQTRRLYLAYFLREPDAAGWQYWIDGEVALGDIASFFAVSPEFVATYGELTDKQFVELIYENVLDRSAEQDGFVYWSGLLEDEGYRRGEIMLAFSESGEFKVNNPLPPTTLPPQPGVTTP